MCSSDQLTWPFRLNRTKIDNYSFKTKGWDPKKNLAHSAMDGWVFLSSYGIWCTTLMMCSWVILSSYGICCITLEQSMWHDDLWFKAYSGCILQWINHRKNLNGKAISSYWQTDYILYKIHINNKHISSIILLYMKKMLKRACSTAVSCRIL